jgi:hypothetical protein
MQFSSFFNIVNVEALLSLQKHFMEGKELPNSTQSTFHLAMFVGFG